MGALRQVDSDKAAEGFAGSTAVSQMCPKYEKNQKLKQHHRDEIVGDDLLDEYRDLNDLDDKSLLNPEETDDERRILI